MSQARILLHETFPITTCSMRKSDINSFRIQAGYRGEAQSIRRTARFFALNTAARSEDLGNRDTAESLNCAPAFGRGLPNPFIPVQISTADPVLWNRKATSTR